MAPPRISEGASQRLGSAPEPPPPMFPGDHSQVLWTLWPQWKGGEQLIARIVQAGQWALRDQEKETSSCRIDVYALGDIESFDSPTEFVEGVSKDALRKLDAVVVRLQAHDIAMAVTFSRGGKRIDSWLTGGVLLQVASSRDEGASDVDAVVARVAPAIGRGRKEGPVLRPTAERPEAEEAFTTWQTRRPFSWLRASALSAAGVVTLLSVYFVSDLSAPQDSIIGTSSFKMSALGSAVLWGFFIEYLTRVTPAQAYWSHTGVKSRMRSVLRISTGNIGRLVLTVGGTLLGAYLKKRFGW